jgi:hypothetical protein
VNTKPFIVTHDEKFCHMEGERIASDDEYAESWYGEITHRYLIWATSPLDAARCVQAHKKEIGRVLPDKYKVFSMQGKHWELHTLGNGDQPEDDKIDLDMFEDMFGHSQDVLL